MTDAIYFSDETTRENFGYNADRRDRALCERQKKRYSTPPKAIYWSDDWNKDTEEEDSKISE